MTAIGPTTIPQRPATVRRLIAAAILTVAGSIGAVVLTPPAAADHQTEQQIKAGCKAANGTYSSQTGGGVTISSCCYRDYKGVKYCDYYTNGDYAVTTAPSLTQPTPVLPARPVPPSSVAQQPPPNPTTPVNPGTIG